jgi:glyoxylase-like metal-dependent hydrolase (beta-lactamase superfamily II)
MTLDGTNTWVLAEPGSDRCVVVDPGPLDESHLARVLRLVEDRGARVGLTLLTHRHWDHAESAQRFAELTGAPVRAIGDGHDDLAAGETVRAAGLEVGVVATPGHTGDSVSFLLPADGALLTGDTILGRGTTVVAWPDGELAAYLQSLERIERLTDHAAGGAASAGSSRGSSDVAAGSSRGSSDVAAVTQILPGHGPTVPDAAGTVRYYLEHRQERLDQVRAALAAGAAQADDVAHAVVERVYADVPREVWPAARLSVLAQLDYLRARA